MGKGKGKFIRLCTRVSKNFIFLEFLNLNFLILKKIINQFSSKNNLKVSYIFKNKSNFFFKNKNIIFFKKYKRF